MPVTAPNALTRLYCVIGNPVSHSFSPAIHNAAFRKAGVNAVYTAFEVTDLKEAMAGMKALGIAGASVTIPHKIKIIPHLDELDDLSKMIGSVNTVTNRGGRLSGSNTDAWGFYKALSEKTGLDARNVAVFGSGGTANAVCFALLFYSKPNRITIVARNAAARESLKENLLRYFPDRRDRVFTMTMDGWKDVMHDQGVIVNTTPVGMRPDTAGSVLPAAEIPSGATVMDIVYRPHKTMLIRNAIERKCRIVYGLDMLLYQGARQFEIWTGMDAPLETMRKALKKAL